MSGVDDSDAARASGGDDSRLAWRRERSEPIADCRVFKVRRDLSADPRGGRAHDFYVIEAPDWINVIPLTKAGEVVLIEQYRHGSEEISLEIPGGMVDPGEEPQGAASRELLEETGYEARAVVLLGRTRPNPAIQDNWIHTFLARDCERRQEPLNAGTERTRVRLVPLESVPALIAGGEITHSLVVAAFHWLGLRGLGPGHPSAAPSTSI
ncbi:MAG TPA: NUDIX hydrolase [Pyrinomonadaceae bacterium]